ncbi:hypothetical protein EDC01DRAFT_597711, partial [Geopyxis carbonaria]
YTVCRKGCICFTGRYEESLICPYCKCERTDNTGIPYRTFSYIPITHRLRLLYSNKAYVQKIEQYKEKLK